MKQERFIDKAVKISDTLHRVNLKTMQSIHQKQSSNQSGKKQKKADTGYQKYSYGDCPMP